MAIIKDVMGIGQGICLFVSTYRFFVAEGVPIASALQASAQKNTGESENMVEIQYKST